jgi:hypothetical protein
VTDKRGSSVSRTSTICSRYWSDLTCTAVTLSGHHFLEDSGLCPLPMRSTALPDVSLIPRWLVPSYTLPRVLAPTWLSQQVFSLDSSISGGKWTDSHWKAAKHLVHYLYIQGRPTFRCCIYRRVVSASIAALFHLLHSRYAVAVWAPSHHSNHVTRSRSKLASC